MDQRPGVAAEQDALSIKQLLELGEMGLQMGYLEQAERYYDGVLGRVPQHPSALLGKAKANRDPHIALAAVEQLLVMRPASREAQELAAQLRARVAAAEPLAPPRLTPVATSSLEEPLDAPPTAHELEVLARLPQAPAGRSLLLPAQPSAKRRGVRGWLYLLLYAMVPRRKGRRRNWVVGYLVLTTVISLAGLLGLGRTASLPTLHQRDVQGLVELVFGQLMAGDTSLPPELVPTEVPPTPVPGVLDRAARATAILAVPSLDGSWSRGSGIMLTSDGLLLTNYHVVAAGSQQLANPEGLVFAGLTSDVREPPSDWYIAALVAADPSRDLAVLRITHTSAGRLVRDDRFVAMPEAPSDALTLGQSVIGLGYPALGGETLTLTRGSMAGYAKQDGIEWGKTDSELLPGSSGGAVLSEQGQLIGVITSVQADERTVGRLSYFILLSEAHDLIQEAAVQPRPHPDISPMLALYQQLVDPAH